MELPLSPDRDSKADGAAEDTEPVERYRAIFENSPNGIALHEIITGDDGEPVDYVFLEVNPGFERIVEIESSELIGKRVTEVFPGIEKEPWIETYGRVALTGEPTGIRLILPARTVVNPWTSRTDSKTL